MSSIDDIKNPYPKDIFIEPTEEQWKKLHDVCEKATGKVLDGFNGSVSRYAFNLAIQKVKEEVIEWIKEDFKAAIATHQKYNLEYNTMHIIYMYADGMIRKNMERFGLTVEDIVGE